jgi:peptidoglycan-associated lipoprotein
MAGLESTLPRDKLFPIRGKKMKLKSLMFVFASLLLVAACSSTPSDSGGAAGAGGSAGGAGAAGTQIAPGSDRDFIVNVGDRVFYDFDRFNVRNDQRATLEKQAAWLKRYPQVQVTIEGHADERGTREYNLALGERRANSAKDFLVANGIAANRIRVISYGKERPVALGHDEASWAQNRRAVTVITSGAVGS